MSDPWLTEVIGRIGYDCVWFDMEHRAFGYDVIAPISLACRHTGTDLMVRILKTGYDAPMRALEFGANGIMVPHCRSAEEARQWVDWVRFPPLGRRGLDGAGADADWGFADTRDHIKHANEEVFLALQIEDREAVENIDEIAAVPGFDLFFIGPGDLTSKLWSASRIQPPERRKCDRPRGRCRREAREMVGYNQRITRSGATCPGSRRPNVYSRRRPRRPRTRTPQFLCSLQQSRNQRPRQLTHNNAIAGNGRSWLFSLRLAP